MSIDSIALLCCASIRKLAESLAVCSFLSPATNHPLAEPNRFEIDIEGSTHDVPICLAYRAKEPIVVRICIYTKYAMYLDADRTCRC